METKDILFKNKTNIQIRMTDLDPFGHVNNGVIYSYYDMGRINYLKDLHEETDWEKMDKVIVHTECDFMESILFDDDIRIESKVISIGNKSIKLLQRIVDSKTGNIKSTCFSVMSGFDRKTNSSKVISSTFKEKVAKYEGISF
jgi:acyl-CoA thioester hydrolase